MWARIARNWISASFLFFVSFGVQTGLANTPDGQTPANEGICDVLIGGTPGLYGLCVAYCEAQDLDVVVADPNDPAAPKHVANQQILENYNKRKRAGDPDMPCVQPPPACQCWSEEELDLAFPQFTTTTACNEFAGEFNGPQLQSNDGGLIVAGAFFQQSTGMYLCRFPAADPFFEIQQGQAGFEVCAASVRDQAEQIGLVCQ